MNGAGTPLVVGIGNILLRDEGVGVHVVRELERRAADGRLDLPPGTRLLDGGTLGLELLPTIATASILVLQAPQRAAAGRPRPTLREIAFALAVGLGSGVIITYVFQELFLVRLP